MMTCGRGSKLLVSLDTALVCSVYDLWTLMKLRETPWTLCLLLADVVVVVVVNTLLNRVVW